MTHFPLLHVALHLIYVGAIVAAGLTLAFVAFVLILMWQPFTVPEKPRYPKRPL